jgi:signal transduction histidine kinase
MASTQVLLVEDEGVVALHLRRQLVKLGYTVAAVEASGEDALRHIEARCPDVVLMDIHLTGPFDGIETTLRIPAELQVPVIYLTAHAEETTLDRARATKPYGYLLKPFSERELHATIQMALARHAADLLLRNNEQRLERLVKARTAELEAQIEHCRRTERALRQAQKLEAIGQLTSGIAHDFNNLLTVVVGGLSLLEKRNTDPSVADLITAALAAANRGASLTRQLLTFGRRQMMRPANLDINDLLLGCNEIVCGAVGPLIEVRYRLEPGRIVCCVDVEELERVILNLAINARQAMEEGGTLTVETSTVHIAPTTTSEDLGAGDYVRITLTDTGHGMTPEVAARAFDPFFTTKEVGEGSGLGLGQAYGFAKQSRGHAAIDSNVDVGTSIILYLPLAVAGEAVGVMPEAAIDKARSYVPAPSVRAEAANRSLRRSFTQSPRSLRPTLCKDGASDASPAGPAHHTPGRY